PRPASRRGARRPPPRSAAWSRPRWRSPWWPPPSRPSWSTATTTRAPTTLSPRRPSSPATTSCRTSCAACWAWRSSTGRTLARSLPPGPLVLLGGRARAAGGRGWRRWRRGTDERQVPLRPGLVRVPGPLRLRPVLGTGVLPPLRRDRFRRPVPRGRLVRPAHPGRLVRSTGPGRFVVGAGGDGGGRGGPRRALFVAQG